MKQTLPSPLFVLVLCTAPLLLRAQTPEVPAWAQPGSATHTQVPPPADFHRVSKTVETPIGAFAAQTDIGAAVVPGSASYDDAAKRYTINSAGYNIWYTRDEFRYLWTKMSGDVSLAADISYPNPGGYGDRKAVLVIRQSLDDDSKEVMTALHGAGLIHLALRPAAGTNIKEALRIEGRGHSGAKDTGTGTGAAPMRIGIEKRGDSFVLYVSQDGEPMHRVGAAAILHFDEPFYVGIGFCSHLPATSDTAVLSNVVLENSAGRIHYTQRH